MATNTTNLNLIKPSGTDKIRIAQINQNMDILDEKIGPVGNTSLQSQITTMNGKTRYVDNENNSFQSFWVSVQSDGRVQISPRTNSGRTMRVITFSENGELMEAKSTDEGTTWNTLWSSNVSRGSSEASATSVSSDLNACDYGGAYMFNSSTSNKPTGITYGVCFTIATSQPANPGVGWVRQIAFGTNDPDSLYMRSRINNNAWTPWIELASTKKDSGLQSIDLSSASFVRYRKIGNIVHVSVKYDPTVDGGLNAWQNKSIGTLPAGYRPCFDMCVRAVPDRVNATSYASVTVNSGGGVFINSRNAAIVQSSGNVIYGWLCFAAFS